MLKLMFSVHNDNDQSLTRLERLLAIFRAKAAEQQLIMEKTCNESTTWDILSKYRIIVTFEETKIHFPQIGLRLRPTKI